MPFGLYTPITWNDGASPPISADNLNSHESVLSLTDEELRRSFATTLFKEYAQRFWSRNVKEIENFSAASEWTADATATVADSSDFILGYNAVKLSEIDNTASWIGMSKTISAMDLTKFNDGEASSTSDIIGFMFYISDITKFTLFQFKLGTDNANNYNIGYGMGGFQNGWNFVVAQKSDFTLIGAANWNNITYLRVDGFTAASAQNQYFLLQYLQLVREDSLYSGYPSAFQEYHGTTSLWQNVYNLYADFVTLAYDERIRRLGIFSCPALQVGGINPRKIAMTGGFSSFVSKMEVYCKKEDNAPGLTWHVDANNYADAYVAGGNFYLNVVEAGASTSQNIALSNTLAMDERIIIELEKNYATIRAVLYKAGEIDKELIHETTIDNSESGAVYIKHVDSNSYGLVTDVAVSSNIGHKRIENEAIPKIYIVNTQQSYVNNTMTNITDLNIYIPPNKTFRIEANFFIRNSGSATPDARIDWTSSSGLTVVSSLRGSMGAPSTTNTAEPAASMRTSVHGIATAVRYALVASTTYSYIKEELVISAGSDGGYLMPRGSQYNTDAANPTELRLGSYVIVTEVFK